MLPRLGRIKLHERAGTGDARILSATVRHERGRWFVSFTVEQDIARPAAARPDVAVGVDPGIKTLAVVADGTGQAFEMANPRHLSRTLRKIRRLSRTASRRQGPDRRTGPKPSNRWHRADAARNRAVAKVADQRKDGIHKLTARLASTYGTIVVEDLHVAGMVRNRRLARHVADASFAEIRRQLAYKTQWHGGRLIVADRWFASSKTCSECGAVKAKLALSERTYCCTACGTILGRDVNAAVNLAKLAGSGPDSNGRGGTVRPGLAGRDPVKRQPGARQRGKTGTADPQGTAAA